MTTELFTKDQFFKVISNYCEESGLKFSERGFFMGEYRYHIYVAVVKSHEIFVEIASSIGPSGVADGTGENSIRLWLSGDNGLPLGSKISRWVTRVPGWEKRMIDQIERLTAMGQAIRWCNKCSTLEKIFIVKKDGPNKGKLFIKCNCPGSFEWLDEIEEEQPDKPVIEKENLPIPVQQSKGEFVPTLQQAAIFAWGLENAGKPNKHLMVSARAGTGKTTTGVEFLKKLPSNLNCCYVAFGKDIATELAVRIGKRDNLRCSTFHSLGFSACCSWYRSKTSNKDAKLIVDEDKVIHILGNVLNKLISGYLYPPVKQLVSLVKANLSGTSEEELDELANYHGIEMNGDRDQIFAAVNIVMAKCVEMYNVIDYDDMCYFPIYFNMNLWKYDFLFTDEAQDVNKNQMELAVRSLKPAGNMIAVGDDFQSMYGFRGADVNAIPNIIERLKMEVLPLSVTRRCPKAVVKLVNDEMPEIDFSANDDAPEGLVRYISEMLADMEYKEGDMVLCRTNAPLIKPAFALIRRGIKAIIRGRDFGKGLILLVRKMKANNLMDLLNKLSVYKDKEVAKLEAANKNNQAQTLMDKVDTIIALCDGVETVGEVEDKIEMIFSEGKQGVQFSSIHRAKGLEAERVYLLHPELLPHPMAKQPWEKDQERNMKYVAYTRVKAVDTHEQSGVLSIVHS